MANPNQEYGTQGAATPPPYDTIRNSSIEARNKKSSVRTYTVFGIIALTLLLVIALIITAVGGIIANVANGNKDPNGNRLDKDIKWGEITVSDVDTKKGSLLLVDATHAYTFPNVSPEKDEDLMEIYAAWAQHTPRIYQLSGLSAFMNKTALVAMDDMLVGFNTATGKDDVLIRYAHRTAEEQTAIGSSTPAGHSDHHTGYGCELKYKKDGNTYEFSADTTYGWITENCHKYGFVIRYPADKADKTGVSDYESYFRYVGPAHATYMTEKDLCLEEYLEEIKKYTQKDPLNITGADGNKYEVYYVAVTGNTTVKVPENFAYTVSGTNEGGVVITINRSLAASSAESTPAESDTAAQSLAS